MDVPREAVGTIDFVGLRISILERGCDAGAPAALGVAGVYEEGIWGCREDVADVVCEAEVFRFRRFLCALVFCRCSFDDGR